MGFSTPHPTSLPFGGLFFGLGNFKKLTNPTPGYTKVEPRQMPPTLRDATPAFLNHNRRSLAAADVMAWQKLSRALNVRERRNAKYEVESVAHSYTVYHCLVDAYFAAREGMGNYPELSYALGDAIFKYKSRDTMGTSHFTLKAMLICLTLGVPNNHEVLLLIRRAGSVLSGLEVDF